MATQATILLVEDNPDDERLAVRALRRANISAEILIARNGEEALATVFNANCLPIVMILDLSTGQKFNGVEKG